MVGCYGGGIDVVDIFVGNLVCDLLCFCFVVGVEVGIGYVGVDDFVGVGLGLCVVDKG